MKVADLLTHAKLDLQMLYGKEGTDPRKSCDEIIRASKVVAKRVRKSMTIGQVMEMIRVQVDTTLHMENRNLFPVVEVVANRVLKIEIEVVPHEEGKNVPVDDLKEIDSQLDTYLYEAIEKINQHLRFSSIRLKTELF